ncbi:MAG: hypothetical protein CVT48_03925 [Thermoplasmata archaeon HGW-Thermoplasmata-1]|nr:MAG: hypothetical protein CVT48_03925 [Thermoplasmata archaeon HGW-Thermoplasmata-1]
MALKVPANDIEKEIFEIWAAISPNKAFGEGYSEYAGKIFVPTEENEARLKSRIVEIRKRTDDEVYLRHLDSMEVDIDFHEPYRVPDAATWGFFGHIIKEGVNEEHLTSFTNSVMDAMDAAKAELSGKEWSTEVKVVTVNNCIGLLAMAKAVRGMTQSSELGSKLLDLEKLTAEYRKPFDVPEIEQGNFDEVYPILEKRGGDIGRKQIYPRILKEQYGYTEKDAGEVEAKGLKWLDDELPLLNEVASRIAKRCGCDPTPEAVAGAISKMRAVKGDELLKFLHGFRKAVHPVMQNRIVRVNPNYNTKIMETPEYLLNQISTAAMSTYDSLTDDQFNVFFVTTDPRYAAPAGKPDLTQTLIHEEYGHCVHFSNSSFGYGAKPGFVEMLSTRLALPVSDGISFYRELEFMRLLRKLVESPNSELGGEDMEFLKFVETIGPLDEVADEVEFIVREWRILRFLRAIGDTRINMHKQSLYEFINWAHEKTGLSKKMVFSQIFIFQAMVGYAPCYSMAGERLREIQETAVANGKDVVDFNTYACSLGVPAREIWEKKLVEWANG